MSISRKSVLPLSSLLLAGAGIAAVLLDAAHAQATVRYGTDPGAGGAEAPQVLSFRGEDAPAPVGEVEHVVEAKETVYALARRYDVAPLSIIEKNELEPPYGLRIGQIIVIPQRPDRPVAPLRRGRVASAPPEERRQREPEVRVVRSDEPSFVQQLKTRFGGDGSGNGASGGGSYTVRQGDTLYSLSKRYGVTVDQLAAANGIRKPYTISIDQRLVIPGGDSPAPQMLTRREEPRPAPVPEAREVPERGETQLSRQFVQDALSPRDLPEANEASFFAWPLRGPVLTDFGDRRNGQPSDGISIAAPIGAPIRAAADGEVVYRGSEVEEYGNLLLVRHQDGWVSAYAHADAMLVRKGDFVRQGQVIAKVGRSGNVQRPQLHFQLRQNLEPQDPISVLQGEQGGVVLTKASLRD